MTNPIALSIGLLVVGFIAYDLYAGLGMGLFLARKLALLIEYVAFWR